MTTQSSPWVTELRKQLVRGKHVILHGNVHDSALVDGALLPFANALAEAIRGCGRAQGGEAAPLDPASDVFSFIVWHNVVDGLFATTESEARAFDAIRRGGGAPRTSFLRTARGWQIQPPSNDGGDRDYASLLGELMVIRDSIGTPHERPFAFVLELAEKLISSEDNQPLIDRKTVSLLKQAGDRAAVYTSDRHMGVRNALVLTASKLGQIPPWLYRDNPAFHLIDVSRPDLRERKLFTDRFLSSLFRIDAAVESDPARRQRVVDDLAAMTDGLCYHDLEALGRTSEREGLPAERPAQLVNYFRFGTRADPWEELRNRYDGALSHLEEDVFGQPQAAAAAARMLVSAVGGISVESPDALRCRPRGVLFFVGPTGVGKTELAKSIARFVFRDPSAMARFDMSEYQREHDAVKLIGSPPSYVGYGEGGQLTNRMRSRPFSVLLFDEVEKADPKILDVFLQILDEGRLTDGAGETVSFSQSLIIFTSNEGSEGIASASGAAMGYPDIFKHFRQAVKDCFITKLGRPELLGRIGLDNVVVFDVLRPQFVSPILRRFLGNLSANAKQLHGLTVTFDATIEEGCAEVMLRDVRLGGRAVRNFVDSEIVPVVNMHALRPRTSAQCTVRWNAHDERCEVRDE